MCIRDRPALVTVLQYASAGEVSALCSLWEPLSAELAGQQLQVLEAIPETVRPQSYAVMLPRPAGSQHQSALAVAAVLDPVESPGILHALGGAAEPYRATEAGVCMLDQEISEWYLTRARDMDSSAGMLRNAIELLTTGMSLGVQGLDELLEVLLDVDTIVRESTDAQMRLLSVQEYEEHWPVDRLDLLLQSSTSGTIVDSCTHGRASQLLATADGPTLLTEWMTNNALSDLSLSAAIVQQSAPDTSQPEKVRLISDPGQLIRVVLSCCYTTERTDQWECMDAMFSSLPNRAATEGRGLEELQDRVDLMDVHLEALETLGRLGAPRALHWVRDATPAQQSELLCAIPRLRARVLSEHHVTAPAEVIEQWRALVKDLLGMHTSCFPAVDQLQLQLEVLSAMLSLEQFEEAAIVISHFDTPLPASTVAGAVIATARETYNACASVHAPGIAQARKCLELVPEEIAYSTEPVAAEVQAEVRLLEVAELLSELDFSELLPLQIRPVSYTHLRAHETVLDLVCRLLLEKKKRLTRSSM
eukprot:TRINITY_DN14034_c0_g1_i1.p1 TRINITY_DN14034_c0_g1~~TRINITY_DN14034_c0_g1_i1.p1  ORF type:complete len:533 (+),score=127.41 TRINITY_DN14034_c0_g1_i1:96-1694(+)